MLVETEVSAHNQLMHALYTKKNIENATKRFTRSAQSILNSDNSDRKSQTEITRLAEEKTKEFEVIYGLPSLSSFLYHDTAKDYEKLRVPVLALFGGRDLQVTIDQNKDRMENALLNSNTSYRFMTFADANHYFQKANTGLREEYATLDKKFVDGFIDTISSWIVNN